MTTKLTGPISPADAEVIAGWLEDARDTITRTADTVEQIVIDGDLLKQRAAAVRAAAREPKVLGEAWAIQGTENSDWCADQAYTDADVAELQSTGFRVTRVQIVEVPENE